MVGCWLGYSICLLNSAYLYQPEEIIRRSLIAVIDNLLQYNLQCNFIDLRRRNSLLVRLQDRDAKTTGTCLHGDMTSLLTFLPTNIKILVADCRLRLHI